MATMTEVKKNLDQALYALNRAIGSITFEGGDQDLFDQTVSARDKVWELITTVDPTRID